MAAPAHALRMSDSTNAPLFRLAPLARVTACCALLALLLPVVACGSDDDPTETPLPGLNFADPGNIASEAGRGSFSFGVATAATQIEDQNTRTDWWAWTSPEPNGLGNGEPVADAVMGFSRALQDVDLIAGLGLDVYRFSVEWGRIEPQRDVVDEAAVTHYDALLHSLQERGVRPMITLHHFSNPVWVDDPRVAGCPDGPTDGHLCGWDHPEGGAEIVAELAEHAALLARRYGDKVDDWATLNEPVNYLIASYGAGIFPPGKALLLTDADRFFDAVRNYLAAHVAIYDAIKANDLVDADGDGRAADVGMTLSVAKWTPARDNLPSTEPEDVAAAERVTNVYHYLFPESLRRGAFDPQLDGSYSESHPDWEGKLDWLGVQYYFRAGVSGAAPIIPRVDAVVCFGPLDQGSCLPPEDATHWVPSMGYEFWAPGLYEILSDFSSRWPDLPMTVTESGIATESGTRRAEHIVRSLEQIHRAREEGVDVRGYYHWSLMDNFEWAEGWEPRFGLFHVERGNDFRRVETEGATILREIIAERRVTPEQSETYGGLGPMTAELESE